MLVASLVSPWLLACGSSNPNTAQPDPANAGSLGVAGSSGNGGTVGGNGPSATGGATAGGSVGLGGTTPGGAGSGGANAGAAGANAGGSGPDTDGSQVIDGPAAHAWNWGTGLLNVDYASYLSKQDIVYSQPNTDPGTGLPLGNGRIGAMVWSPDTLDGLAMQIGGVDLSPQSTFGAGLVSWRTTPAPDTTSFEQRLALHDGELRTRFGDRATVTILGSPKSEVMGIHVEDARTDVTDIVVELSLWDLSDLQNYPGVPNFDAWKTPIGFADATAAGFSRGQQAANGWGYTLAANVEGATFTTELLANDQVRLHIVPSPSYTVWFTAASSLNAPIDSVSAARAALDDTKTMGYATVHGAAQGFWHEFWGKSFVQYSDDSKDADYLENFYYFGNYVIAAGGYGNYPFHFINGVFRATGDETKWSNAYWYWNQRDVYHSFLASNHPELVDTFNNLYARNAETLRAFTQTRYVTAGLWVPETMGYDGSADGTVNSEFTQDILSTGTEAALNMYDQYRYTNDAVYLSETVYPFMRDVANLYLALFSHDQATDSYFMESSNSHETYWDVRNAITDLVSVRKMFPVLIALSTELGLDDATRPQWQDLLDHVVPYPSDGMEYLPHEPPLVQTGNNENVACELIWPYGVTGVGAPDYAIAATTWRNRPFPYGNVWANDAIQAARLGLGDEAFQGMKTMIDRYQNFPNGFTTNTNGVFEYWGVHLTAMNESVLHSYDDKIRVFPALPELQGLVSRFTLAARGGFLVSAEREQDEIKYVGIRSLAGKQAIVINPWPGEMVAVRNMTDDSIVLTSADAELAFPTTALTSYAIERTGKPLSSFEYGHIEAPAGPTTAPRQLSGTQSTLGL
jgi:hypothetical protein